ncbi:serine hydrolase domain-containing protein [Actinocatenispora sera]|uniref:serine hydrolase domain-containing protein n=1 Tax=Actinocatenispora sera TaxID=390989 RepID=UPI0033D11063
MAENLSDIVADLTAAGVPGVLLRVADHRGTVAELTAGHRQTYRMAPGSGWLPAEESSPTVSAATPPCDDPAPVGVGPAGRHPRADESGGEPRRPLVRLADPAPLTPDAVFDLASVSKVAGTTAALMTLAESGAVDVDGPARDWLPALAPDIRVRDLLRHRAGLAEWWPMYAGSPMAGSSAAGDADPAAAIATLPARYPIDAERHYSDLGFMLLGLIVTRAAGRPLDDAVRRLVVEPAGMTGAHYRPGGRGPAVPLVATGHGDWYERRMLATGQPYPTGIEPSAFGRWREHTIVGEVHDGNAWHGFGGVAGHAGLFGGADDLVAFGRALLAADGPWRPETVRRFAAVGPDAGQGLGFWRWPEHGAIGHGGFTGIRFGVLPDVQRIVLLMTNRVHATGTRLLDLNPYWDRILTAAREQT